MYFARCIGSRVGAAALVAAMLVTAADGQQVPPPSPQPPAYPADYEAQPQASAPRPHRIRELFAGTLAAIVQGVTGGLVMSVTQGVTGSITGWFAKQQRKHGIEPSPYDPYAQSAYPAAQYPATQYPSSPSPDGQYPAYDSGAYPTAYPTVPDSGQPQYPMQPAYPGTPLPQPASDPYGSSAPSNTAGTASYPPGSDPAVGAYGASVYDARTGQLDPSAAAAYWAAPSDGDAALYAGVAYEVHALGTGGESIPANAATHVFHTGDRFTVYFRPSVPGRMDVYNVNPLGQQSLIDSVNMAAGQLSTLGPYEFAATKGDELLRLVLTPCSNPQLIVQTRNIVNVTNASATGGFSLVDCSAPAFRSLEGVKTRDIRKVVVDGSTSFALDPISQAEVASGQLAPRETTIVFHHR